MKGEYVLIINGKYSDAVVYGNLIEECAVSQIGDLCNHPAFEGAVIRVMPDCHAGKGCVIGFTSVSNNHAVIPNVVGVDIGCGILTAVFTVDSEIDYLRLDQYIRSEIPSSVAVRTSVHSSMSENKAFIDRLNCVCEKIRETDNITYHLRSLGTLGGGNHFIEIDRLSENKYLLLVHTGSRGFGKKICSFYQSRADVYDVEKRRKIIEKHRLVSTLEEHDIINREAECIPSVERELAFLTGEKYYDYIECMIFAKEYAALNRRIILDSIIDFLASSYSINVESCFDTIHNYLDWYDETHTGIVIRKGAVSAYFGEKLVIPLNMRDGVVIAVGKGNEEWNCSAPHGAGRILSRSEARRNISLEEYINVMDGINTWSVCEETLDEAPQAYKPTEEIIGCIGETVDILEIAKPVYNFKAS